MIWKYHLPHDWEGGRATWEDVQLLPCDSTYAGEPLCLTVEALGSALDEDERSAMLELLAGRRCHWEEMEMIVATEDFTQEELMGWIRLWCEGNDLQVEGLVQVGYDDFVGAYEPPRQAHGLREAMGGAREQRG